MVIVFNVYKKLHLDLFVAVGYVLQIQAGRAPRGVHKGDKAYSGWDGNTYPAPDDGTISSQSHFPDTVIPETLNASKSQVKHFKSGQGHSGAVYNPPAGINQASSDSSEGGVVGSFSPLQGDKATVRHKIKKALNYAPSGTASPRVLESHKIRFNPSRTKVHLIRPQKPSHKTAAVKKGHPFGRRLAGKIHKHRSNPSWGPRAFSDKMSESRGYAHVYYIKPGFDKKQQKLPSSKRWLNPNCCSKPHNIRHLYQPERAQRWVQGKFKPFQRVSNEHPVHNRSENETAHTSAEISSPPTLNSTNITSLVPTVNGESSMSAVPTWTEGHVVELESQTSNHVKRSESTTEAGLSWEPTKPVTVSPTMLQQTETNITGHI